jgi:hypothetical protein
MGVLKEGRKGISDEVECRERTDLEERGPLSLLSKV